LISLTNPQSSPNLRLISSAAVKTGFIDKLIERLGRVRPEEARAHLLRVVREKGFLETIFNAIQEGVLVTDSSGKLLYLNDAACEFFGLDGNDSIGRPLAERVRGLDWKSLTAGAEIGKLVSRDMEVFYPTNRFLNFYVVPLSLEDADEPADDRRSRTESRSNRVGYAVIVRDITESRRSAQATIENERLSALTMLAAGVAHEIGNPLNSLDIHLQLMERKLRRMPPAQRGDMDDSVRVARDEIRRLDFIVSQFLRAIRPAPLDLQPADVNAVVEESVSFLAAEIANRDILVEQELDRRLPPLEIDRDQMKQAFYNIIRNSFQAMKSGGILRISTAAGPDDVAIAFADTGGGIAPENMSKVFDPYFTTKSAGSGLGLLIVRRIVREHGGEIELRSDTGRGLSVTIHLPHGDRRARMLEFGGDADAGSLAPDDPLPPLGENGPY
jgi:two-component system, sporulation sensor kinase E